MISTRELARIANVSQSTVSRSLRDSPEISVETKTRIWNIAKQHGYITRENPSKTVMSGQRKAIGVLITFLPFLNDICMNQLLSTLYSSIEEENYYAIPLINYSGEEGVQKLRNFIRLGLVEGFIIINRTYDPAIDAYLNEVGMPVVYLIYYSRDAAEHTVIVDADNYMGGHIAAQHLISLGHRDFVVITSQWDEFKDRTRGFLSGLSDNGLSIPPENIFCEDCFYDVGYRLISENLHLFQKATAIYVQADIVAFGVVNALKDHGISVPDEVSVIGTDGLELGALCRPQLTSIASPFRDMANITIGKLMEVSNNPGKETITTRTILPPSLLVRESTAPPPRRTGGGEIG